jgi:hypothetical protein
MIGFGDNDELEESDKYIRCLNKIFSKTTFFLPISNMGLILGDKPLVLQEERDLEDIHQPFTEEVDFGFAFVGLPTIHGF